MGSDGRFDMGMIEEVAAWLVTQSCGTAGTSLFAGVLPDSTGLAAGIIERAGGPPSRTYQTDLPWAEDARIRVLVRSTQPSSGATLPVPTNARERAQKIWRALDGVTNSTSIAAGKMYLRIEALQSPWLERHDEKGRVVYACDYAVTRVPTTSD